MRRAVLVFATLVACDHHTAAPPAPATSASIAATPVASAAALGGGTPCGELSCTQFDSPRDAMRAALAGDARVVAIGEVEALLALLPPLRPARVQALLAEGCDVEGGLGGGRGRRRRCVRGVRGGGGRRLLWQRRIHAGAEVGPVGGGRCRDDGERGGEQEQRAKTAARGPKDGCAGRRLARRYD